MLTPITPHIISIITRIYDYTMQVNSVHPNPMSNYEIIIILLFISLQELSMTFTSAKCEV